MASTKDSPPLKIALLLEVPIVSGAPFVSQQLLFVWHGPIFGHLLPHASPRDNIIALAAQDQNLSTLDSQHLIDVLMRAILGVFFHNIHISRVTGPYKPLLRPHKLGKLFTGHQQSDLPIAINTLHQTLFITQITRAILPHSQFLLHPSDRIHDHLIIQPSPNRTDPRNKPTVLIIRPAQATIPLKTSTAMQTAHAAAPVAAIIPQFLFVQHLDLIVTI